MSETHLNKDLQRQLQGQPQKQSKNYHVIVQTAFIGDLFLSIPFLQRLRKTNPQHQLILVCKKSLGEVFLQEKLVDEVIEVEKNSRASYHAALFKLKDKSIDHVYCLHRSVRSSLFTFQIQARKKMGFRNFINVFLFSKTVTYKKEWPDVPRQLSLLTATDQELWQKLNAQDWAYLNFKNELGRFRPIPDFMQFPPRTKKMLAHADQALVSTQNRKIAIFPGSVWETKKWTTIGFSQLTQKLLAEGHTVVLMGASAEKNICDQIQKENPKALNFSGELSLSQTYEYLKTCDVVICNDSAPSHMAASLQIPVVSIFGPTTLNLGFRPWNDDSTVAENENLDCRPCGAHGHQKCPLVHHKCMRDLTVEQVLKAFHKIKIG